MDELHEADDAIDKLLTEADHLERIAANDLTPEGIDLALSVAKRVRRDATLVVRVLARLRDELQPRRAQAHD